VSALSGTDGPFHSLLKSTSRTATPLSTSGDKDVLGAYGKPWRDYRIKASSIAPSSCGFLELKGEAVANEFRWLWIRGGSPHWGLIAESTLLGSLEEPESRSPERRGRRLILKKFFGGSASNRAPHGARNSSSPKYACGRSGFVSESLLGPIACRPRRSGRFAPGKLCRAPSSGMRFPRSGPRARAISARGGPMMGANHTVREPEIRNFGRAKECRGPGSQRALPRRLHDGPLSVLD